MRWGTFVLVGVVAAGLALGVGWYVASGRWTPSASLPVFTDPEVAARRAFYRDHPGEKPLNWAIGRTAERFHRQRPMGRFRLHANDCSDYVDCIIDEALGAKARFRRDSTQHVLSPRRRLWDLTYWDRHEPLLPGDVISVEHSPHYEPYEGAIRHVGVLGADGRVYDWSKLKSWPTDRYGRNSVAWFTRHSPGPRGVVIQRLKPEYRYRARAVR